jgi:hypothetical protein
LFFVTPFTIKPKRWHINLRWCYVNKFKVYKTKTTKIWFYSTEKWRKFKILILSNWGMVLFYLVIYLVSWICFIVVGLEIPYSFMILALSNQGFFESSIIFIFSFKLNLLLWGVFGVLGDHMFSSNFKNQLKGLLKLFVKLHRDLFWFW